MGVYEFRNEAFLNFNDPANRESMTSALAKVKSELGREYPLVIGGEKIFTEKKSVSINPANVDEVVGTISQADKQLAETAMQAALVKFEEWKFVDPEIRADYLFKAAAEMRRRKFEFMAWMVYEVGKNWGEADADVAEAIDFMEFYAREMVRLSRSWKSLLSAIVCTIFHSALELSFRPGISRLLFWSV